MEYKKYYIIFKYLGNILNEEKNIRKKYKLIYYYYYKNQKFIKN